MKEWTTSGVLIRKQAAEQKFFQNPKFPSKKKKKFAHCSFSCAQQRGENPMGQGKKNHLVMESNGTRSEWLSQSYSCHGH